MWCKHPSFFLGSALTLCAITVIAQSPTFQLIEGPDGNKVQVTITGGKYDAQGNLFYIYKPTTTLKPTIQPSPAPDWIAIPSSSAKPWFSPNPLTLDKDHPSGSFAISVDFKQKPTSPTASPTPKHKEDIPVATPTPSPALSHLTGTTSVRLVTEVTTASITQGSFAINIQDVNAGATGTLSIIFKKKGGSGEVIVKTITNQAPGTVTVSLDDILLGSNGSTPSKPLDTQDAAVFDRMYAKWVSGSATTQSADHPFDVYAIEVLAKRTLSQYFSPEWGGTWAGSDYTKGCYPAGHFDQLHNIGIKGELLDALSPANEGIAMDGTTVIRDRLRDQVSGFERVTTATSIPDEADKKFGTKGYICFPDVSQDNASSSKVQFLNAKSVAITSSKTNKADRLVLDDEVYIPTFNVRSVDDYGGGLGAKQIDVWYGQGDRSARAPVQNYMKSGWTCLKVIKAP